jgi:hypothetical protein
MKPREKVVTAEDVQSCLYYVHVDQPDDARLITSPPESHTLEGQVAPHIQPLAPSVQRKAVPAALMPGLPAAPKRKPIPGSLAPVNDFETRQNISATEYTQRHLERPSFSPRLSVDSARYPGGNDQPLPSLPPRRHSDQPQPKGTSLTLIRRDPASSAQWNVAIIEDPPIFEVSSISLKEPNTMRRAGAPMYIEVTNPGYSKFLHSDQSSPAALMNRASDMVPGAGIARDSTDQPNDRGTVSGPIAFRRRLWMEGAKYSGNDFGHRKNSSYDAALGRQSPRSSFESSPFSRLSLDYRAGENSFISRDEQPYSTIPGSEKQSGFRGYVFTSPWNGRCEFVTGAGGGSLKVSHEDAGSRAQS